MFLLNNLQKVVNQRKQRKGRGEGSNRGKNSGKGHKGQTKRGHVRIGFEGGQKPLNRRLPKFKGFNARDNKQRVVLTLSDLDKAYAAGEEVSLSSLREKGLISEKIKQVRVVNTGTLSKKLVFVEADNLHLTKGVKEIIK